MTNSNSFENERAGTPMDPNLTINGGQALNGHNTSTGNVMPTYESFMQ